MLEAVEVLSTFYLNVAFYPVDKRLERSIVEALDARNNPLHREMKISLSQIKDYGRLKRLLETSWVPMPSDAAPGIKLIKDGITIAKQGISLPKIARCLEMALLEDNSIYMCVYIKTRCRYGATLFT